MLALIEDKLRKLFKSPFYGLEDDSVFGADCGAEYEIYFILVEQIFTQRFNF